MQINLFHDLRKPNQSSGTPLVEGSFIALTLAILGFVAQYLYNVVLARSLATIDYGDFSLLASTAHFFGVLLLMGNDDTSVKFLPVYFNESIWGNARALLHYYRRHLWITCLTVFILGILLRYLSLYHYLPESKNHVVWQYIWIIPFSALLIFSSTLLRTLKHPHLSLFLYVIAPPLLTILFLMGLHFFHYPFGLIEAIWAYCISYILIVVIEIFMIKISLPAPLLTAEAGEASTRVWFFTGIQLLFTGLIFTCFQSIVSLILKLTWHDSHAVGIFTAVYTISGLMWISSMACSAVIAPLIGPAAAQKDSVRLQKLYTLGSSIMFGFGALVFLGFIFWGTVLLRHFGARYVAEGYEPLLIIGIGNLISLGAGGMCFNLLENAGDSKLLMKVTVIFTLIGCLMGAVLCHFFGLYGAAYFVAILEGGVGIVYGLLIHHKFGILPFRFS